MEKIKGKLTISAMTLLLCIGVGLQLVTHSSFNIAKSVDYDVWHHYDKKIPTLNEKGIKEYWVRCGGSYQFEAPTSGTIVDMGSNYDTSEFSTDDDRWLTYCEEYGHTLDSYDICSVCGELDSEMLVSDTAIYGSAKVTNVNSPKGFNESYKIDNINNGNRIGIDADISAYQYVYFALMQDSLPSLYVYGGDERYAIINRNVWYYFLLVKDRTTDLFSLYIRDNLSASWVNKYLDAADQSTLSFNNLRFYNWSYSNYSIYCSELYVADFKPETHTHSYDSHNICTICMEHKDSFKAANCAISGSIRSSFATPKGFDTVYSVTGKSSGYVGADLNVSEYSFIYFALYTENGSARPFSGGDDGDGTHRIVWSGRWYYLLLEKIDGRWNGFIKEGVEGAWYTRTVDGGYDTNLSSLLRLYNWDGLENVTIYNTEVYCDKETPIPIEKTKALNIGIWNGSYHFTNTSSIDDLVSAGIDVVIGVNPIWNNNWESILNYAKTKGVKFIVDPRKWDYQNSCYADWDGTCPSYANHDAVLGFLMWDEPSTLKYSQIASLKATFDAVMPEGKLFFVNLLSSAVSLSGLYGTEYATSSYNYYETNYAKAYQNTVNPDLYSFDSYPLFTNGQIRKAYFSNFDIWSNLSKTYEIPTWLTFLSCSHNSGDGAGYTYVLPSQAQLEWQMSIGITFGMTNLMHYIYATDASDYSCMANINGSTNEYFNIVKLADKNMSSLNDDIVDYGWEGAVACHTGSKVNLLFKELKHTLNISQVGIDSVASTSDFLIGSYIDDNQNRAYMVTNSGYSNDYSSILDSKYRNYNANISYVNTSNSVSITLAKNIVGAYVIQNGIKTYVSTTNNKINLNLQAYGSAFIIPVV